VRTKIWATQSHNEDLLSRAFQSAENVYLVFSANKSGEYFGFARMMSPISQDPAAAIEFAPRVQAPNDMDVPKAIPTEADGHAPRGRIIDDSARGTIFWEFCPDEEDSSSTSAGGESAADGGGKGGDNKVAGGGGGGTAMSDGDGGGGSKAWGKPFRLEWLSTARLPFYRTRGLRNPLNSNREVKIARDGTELDPGVGRRLISLFNVVHSSPAPLMVAGALSAAPGRFGLAGGPFRGAVHDVVGPGFAGGTVVVAAPAAEAVTQSGGGPP